MFFQNYLPAKILQPYIYHYSVFEFILDEQRIPINYPCNSCVLVINYGATPTYEFPDKQMVCCRSFMGGILNHIYISHPGNYKGVAVFFNPLGAYHLFKIPQLEYYDQFICIDHLLGKKANMLAGRLNEVREKPEIVKVLDHFFIEKLTTNLPETNYLDYAVELIYRYHGNIKIDRLCKYISINRRTLERHFKIISGVKPKTFAFNTRLHYVFKTLLTSGKPDLHDLIYKTGYHDQSHMLKDFKKYGSASPKKFDKNYIKIIKLYFQESESMTY